MVAGRARITSNDFLDLQREMATKAIDVFDPECVSIVCSFLDLLCVTKTPDDDIL